MAGEVIIGLVERGEAAEREAEAATNHAGITASRQGPLEEEAATLRVQHEADAKRIAELEAANRTRCPHRDRRRDAHRADEQDDRGPAGAL